MSMFEQKVNWRKKKKAFFKEIATELGRNTKINVSL